MKSLFEQMGATYTLQGDYYFPNLTLPIEENKPRNMGTAAYAVSQTASQSPLYESAHKR